MNEASIIIFRNEFLLQAYNTLFTVHNTLYHTNWITLWMHHIMIPHTRIHSISDTRHSRLTTVTVKISWLTSTSKVYPSGSVSGASTCTTGYVFLNTARELFVFVSVVFVLLLLLCAVPLALLWPCPCPCPCPLYWVWTKSSLARSDDECWSKPLIMIEESSEWVVPVVWFGRVNVNVNVNDYNYNCLSVCLV